ADRAAVLDKDAGDMGAGFDDEVRPLSHRNEKRGRGVASPAALQRQLVAAEAVASRAVEVGGRRMAGLGAGGEPRLAVRMVVAKIGDAELAVSAVPLALAAIVALRSLEERQHLAVAPAARAVHARPVVEVGRLAADVEQAVDDARAAERLAARPRDRTAAGARFGLERKLPGEARVVDRAEVADRQAQPEVARLAPRFEQEDAARRVGGEPVGENAAGRTAADDDDVEAAVAHHGLFLRTSALDGRQIELRK